ncbi:MAG: hypothetical protein JXP34_28910 [Planctomycetes bacterium]|nr:hypothetical protein [Planctomycetota bacterium]
MVFRFAAFLAAAQPGAGEPAGISPWIYVHGVGGIVFALGLVACLRTRQIDVRERRGRRTLVLMVAGFAGYALLQGAMQVLLPRW